MKFKVGDRVQTPEGVGVVVSTHWLPGGVCPELVVEYDYEIEWADGHVLNWSSIDVTLVDGQ